MPRSSYIYLVQGVEYDTPIVAFTVKRELKRWLERPHNPDILIYRIQDGVFPSKPPTLMTDEELARD